MILWLYDCIIKWLLALKNFEMAARHFHYFHTLSNTSLGCPEQHFHILSTNFKKRYSNTSIPVFWGFGIKKIDANHTTDIDIAKKCAALIVRGFDSFFEKVRGSDVLPKA